MSPVPGDAFGPYEIIGLLGVGGMGQVYRARDTRLGRDVALKLLPDDFAQDPDRLARFRREAQVLAALNHPHIAAIYGLEESAGVRALVLELVEGPTLEEAIFRGPGNNGVALPLEDALPIARQIGEALETAHEQGIVHRDLKPANIKLRPDGVVKVLDFGLAKAIQGSGPVSTSAGAYTNSPTLTSPAMTMQGIILGTAAYMSPEQAKGRESDRRTDIWAFGCVFFEMLTGKHPFDAGDSVSEAIANILKTEPNWSALPADTPPSIRRLLRRCLAKDQQKREPHIGAVRLAIDEARESPREEPTQHTSVAMRTHERRVTAIWAASAAIITAAVIIGLRALLTPAPTPPSAVTFTMMPPSGWQMGTPTSGPPAPQHAVSPDGERIAFVAYPDPSGASQLWVRRLADFEPTVLRGTEGATFPFWSPDGRSVAFFSDGKLKKIDASGGPVTTLCDATGPGTFGGTWNANEEIVFSAFGSGPLFRVSSSGGTPSPATTLEPGETSHRWPQFLPDGRRFLYVSGSGSQSSLYVGSLDTPERTLVRSNTYRTLYTQGYLLTVSEEATLTVQAFDEAQARTTGQPQPIIERVGVNVANANTGFSLSHSGVLAFREGIGIDQNFRLYWADRSGRRLEDVGEPRPYGTIRLSPDERAVVARLVNTSGRGDWWIIDLARGGLARQLTFTGEVMVADRVAWSPDSARIVFAMGPTPASVFMTPILSAEAPASVYKTAENNNPMDWSPDGRLVLFGNIATRTGLDLWTLSADTYAASPFLATPFNESNARFSPDGRWVAYVSNEDGTANVYVMPTSPSDKRKWKISSDGGSSPRWRADGRELFFTVGRSIMATDVRSDGTLFQPEAPRELFMGALTFNGARFEVGSNGQRFLLTDSPAETEGTVTSPLTVVLNWLALVGQQKTSGL